MSIRQILNFFNNPQDDEFIHFIHIAGTKGKTSTSYYIYQLLQQLGCTVGLFVSPHVYSSLERIQLNGKYILQEEFDSIFHQIKEAEEILNITLNFFEQYLVVAFLFFKKRKPQYVVLEVGIGGLLDSTNIISPKISVISLVQKDHENILGKTLWQILAQKLGILKEGKPFIIGKQGFFVSLLLLFQLKNRRKNRKKMLYFWKIKNKNPLEFDIQIGRKHYIHLIGPLFMIDNFMLAYSTLFHLQIQGLDQIKTFQHSVPGRFEIVQQNRRLMILDGAHNPIAFQKLKASLTKAFATTRWNVIFMVKEGKNFSSIFKIFQSMILHVFVYRWEKIFGSLFESKYLLSYLERNDFSFTLFEDEKALKATLQTKTFILVTGSFYHLSYCKKIFLGDANEILDKR